MVYKLIIGLVCDHLNDQVVLFKYKLLKAQQANNLKKYKMKQIKKDNILLTQKWDK